MWQRVACSPVPGSQSGWSGTWLWVALSGSRGRSWGMLAGVQSGPNLLASTSAGSLCCSLLPPPKGKHVMFATVLS